jgi:uncharacterized protein (TIGR03435 family)
MEHGPNLKQSIPAVAPSADGFRGIFIRSRARHSVIFGRIAQQAGRIVDRTGLKGGFKMDLEYSPDQTATDKPSIFTAVQEQLGLKLESTRGPVNVVVIDHVERPTED